MLRCRSLMLSCLALGWFAIPSNVSLAQFPPGFFAPDDEPPRAVLPVDRRVAQALAEAETQVQRGEFLPAVQLLQMVLDQPEDSFLDSDSRGSTKRRALELLRSLPDAARRTYELEVGHRASELRERGLTRGDEAALREAVRRYCLTNAGAETHWELGARAFDSGDFLSAALLWEQWQLARPSALTPGRQVQLAVAWDLARHPERGRDRLQSVVGLVRLMGRDVPLPPESQSPGDWLTAKFGLAWSSVGAAVADWTEVRGGGTRHESAQPTGPVGGPIWHAPVITSTPRDSDALQPPQLAGDHWIEQQIQRLVTQMTTEDKLVIPAAAPIVSGDTVVLRSLSGLMAVDLRSGQIRWRAVLSDPQLQRSRQALQSVQDSNQHDQLAVYLARLNGLLRDELFRDATRGSLSTDGRWVFAIEPDDVPVSTTPELPRFGMRNVPNPPTPTNKLVVYDLEGGRLTAEIGGHREEPALAFGGTYFLGPPLCHDGRIFCLAESGGVLQLLQMRYSDEPAPHFVREWSQDLAAPERPLHDAPLRRMAGLTPSAAGPLLICPTAAGLVTAVDSIQQQLRWGYQYETLEVRRIQSARAQLQFRLSSRFAEVDEEAGRWLECAPIIAGGRVLLTPRDSAELHCLDLLDGTLLWKRPRGQGLCVAGVKDDCVVIVGQNQLEAFRVADGEPAWPSPVSIPPPSGRGLLLDQRYLLPLSTGEIATVDLSDGRILARSRLEAGRLPGNLAASGGALVSQSLRDLVGYASQREIDAEIAARFAVNPQDPRALGLRGELRLHRGELEDGLTDLRAAQKQQPDPRTSVVLAGALLHGLRTDFARYRTALDELDHLTLDRQQRHEFLRLFAEGLTREGRKLEALQQYLRLAESAGDDPLLERVEDSLAARSDRVIQGHVQTLYESATEAERNAMDAELKRLALRASSAESIDVDRRFLRYFALDPAATEVQRRVISHDLQSNVTAAQRELLALASSRDRSEAGYACAQLAKLFADQPQSPAARPWIHQLATEFRSLPVLDGKTGGELLADWHVDADPFASSTAPSWPAGDPELERISRLAAVRRIRQAEVVGPVPPRFADWSFELVDDAVPSLIARDTAGRARWSAAVPADPEDQQVGYASRLMTPRVFAAGAWVALSVGTKFAVWEVPAKPGDPRFCWQHTLTPAGLAGVGTLSLNPMVQQNGRRRLQAGDPTGVDVPGQVVGVTSRSVVYHLGARLLAVDPATGSVQWVRQNVPRLIEATVDESCVALFDVESGRARIYRTVDGVELARRDIGRPENWLWFHGDRLLTLTREDELQRLTMHALSTGDTLWRQDLSLSVRCRVVDHRELLLLDKDGALRSVSLDDAAPQWEAKLPPLNAIDYLWARRVGDRYDLAIRQPLPQSDARRVVLYDANQVPFSGTVAAVDGKTGELLWTTEVGPTAFDVLQVAETPILAFAGRVAAAPSATRRETPALPGLSATFIDARSGAVLYQTSETSAPTMYQIELDGDHRKLTVNFLAWVLEFRWPEEKPEAR